MKTFDEAWETLNKQDKELLFENFKSDGILMFSNENWTKNLKIAALHTIKDMAMRKEDPLVLLCSALHTLFVLGVLTGIEMGKPNET